jgi:hypothetical protein
MQDLDKTVITCSALVSFDLFGGIEYSNTLIIRITWKGNQKMENRNVADSFPTCCWSLPCVARSGSPPFQQATQTKLYLMKSQFYYFTTLHLVEYFREYYIHIEHLYEIKIRSNRLDYRSSVHRRFVHNKVHAQLLG